MSAEGSRMDSQPESTYVVNGATSDAIDVPGLLASEIADLYADSERERRIATMERAIERAKEGA